MFVFQHAELEEEIGQLDATAAEIEEDKVLACVALACFNTFSRLSLPEMPVLKRALLASFWRCFRAISGSRVSPTAVSHDTYFLVVFLRAMFRANFAYRSSSYFLAMCADSVVTHFIVLSRNRVLMEESSFIFLPAAATLPSATDELGRGI
eukprot:5094554-Pleurochrysis_carterae.AAC.1